MQFLAAIRKQFVSKSSLGTAEDAAAATRAILLFPAVLKKFSIFKHSPHRLLTGVFDLILKLKLAFRLFFVYRVKFADHAIVYMEIGKSLNHTVRNVTQSVENTSQLSDEYKKGNASVGCRIVSVCRDESKGGKCSNPKLV